jgi:hypothetical protein
MEIWHTCELCKLDELLLYYYYKDSSNMEENSVKPYNFQIELQNLTNLQAKIEETRRSLNQLVKI